MTTSRSVTPRQVEAFKALMETGLVTGAARRMSLSQPAVSKLLMHFEYATGLTLFDRIKKRLVPTAEARILLREVDRIYAGLEEIAAKASALRGLRAGEITVASVSALGHQYVPRLVAGFLKERPEVNVSLYVASATDVAQWVIAEKIDLGVTFSAVEHPAVESELICEKTAVCVLPCGHRLARRKQITPEQLEGENFVSFTADSRIRHAIDTVFERAGVRRRLAVQAFASSSACSLVANGSGVSIVEPFTAEQFGKTGQLVVKPFAPAVHYQFHLVYPRFKPRSVLVQAFAEELSTMVRSARLVA